jgi:5-methylcytosine-specific restriction enzyme subunit McrC
MLARVSWADLLKLARLLLGNRFQTTTYGEAAGFSLLFEMNTLFEEFVGSIVQTIARREARPVTLQGPRNHALTDSSGIGRFATIPDIMMDDWIIDTKWKHLTPVAKDPELGIDQGDVYQLMAYAAVYKRKKLMLLYPHHESVGGEAGHLADFRVSGTDSARLVVASLDLASIKSVPEQLRMLLFEEHPAERDRVSA